MQKKKKWTAVLLAAMLLAGSIAIPAAAEPVGGAPVSSESAEPTESSEAPNEAGGETSQEESSTGGEASGDESSTGGEASQDESSTESEVSRGESSTEGEASREESSTDGETSQKESSEESGAEGSAESAAPGSGTSQNPNAENSIVPTVLNTDTGIKITREGTATSYNTLAEAVSALQAGDTLTLAAGTYSPTANEQMRITANNVTLEGAGSGKTIIDCGSYSVSGQAGILVTADGVTVRNLSVTSSASDVVSALKYSYVEDLSSHILQGGLVKNVTISSAGHGLNLHGTDGVEVAYVTFTSVGKANIALAMSTNVFIAGTTTSADSWADVAMMYADRDAYATPCSVTIGHENSFNKGLIYSERPASASVDTIFGLDSIGMEIVSKDDGTWATKPLEITDVASIGGQSYDSLQAAVETAPIDGTPTTITLLKSVEHGGQGIAVAAGQNIIIDFGGFTYSADQAVGSSGTATNGFQLKKDSTVTLKNGTLMTNTAKTLIQNYSNLTLEDIHVDGSKSAVCTYVIGNNNGTIQFIGNTSITAGEGNVAFDVYDWRPAYQGVNVTVNTTGAITGNIEVGGSGESNPKLTIQNGTFTGTITKTSGSVSISGGKFSKEVDEAFLAAGVTAPKVGEYYVAHTHDKGDVIPAKEATCTETGLTAGAKCSVCGEVTQAQATVALKAHTLTAVPAKDATYTENGNSAYWSCSVCGKWFSDAAGANEISDHQSVVIPRLVLVDDGKADVSEEAVDQAITQSGSNVVALPLKDADETVTSVQLPASSLQKVAEAGKFLSIETSEATVTLDANALAAIAEKAGSNADITMEVVTTKEENLSADQKKAIEGKDVALVFSAEIQSGNQLISSFGDGKIMVQIPFTPAQGTEASAYKVLYVADDGTIEEIATTYKDGCLVVVLDHFSEYVVVNTSAAPTTKPSETPGPTTEPSATPAPSGTPAPTTNPSATPAPSVTPGATTAPSTLPTASPAPGPKTGDTTNTALPIAAAVVAAMGIAAAVVLRVRRKTR